MVMSGLRVRRKEMERFAATSLESEREPRDSSED